MGFFIIENISVYIIFLYQRLFLAIHKEYTVYAINRMNVAMMMKFTNFMKLQYIVLSSDLHCIVVPNIPKIPEPNIPPLPVLGGAF